ncbi:hypothetical protein COU49_01000 [Candidatus Nomurabacteria bacterium CG10_big_fil_rev_8_21_14_0_10_35_16]|uniref:VanZ-like domain-containing protein n=1 Tax=Candidatus Nomurabacteria bacterium CG10_big_fil_rev_8_21_14_0_10_35_16 TaxID=1974731 RepID=A0A2H0TBR4_9BACT|nr:MAG: hypothetical protein COU49_01000 [Candidatus Nomurabacteria bacterium CG10_big_fil_rev_8_21_14_0_10_35_16]
MWLTDKRFILFLAFFLFIAEIFALHSTWARLNIPNIDIPLHLLGGVMSIAIFFYLFEDRADLFDLEKNYPVTIIFAISFSMFLGVLIEFYEFGLDYFHKHFLGIVLPTTFLTKESLKDLVNDFLGGSAGIFIYLKAKKKYLIKLSKTRNVNL